METEPEHKHHKIFFASSVIYLLGVSALMLRHNIWFSPDQFFIFALVVAVFLGRGKKFIRDWMPVILVFLSYEFFRGALPAIIKFPIHSQDLIILERGIFGTIPTLVWQNILLDPQHLRWYDYFFSLSYMSFWIVPLVYAYYLWMKHHSVFIRLSYGFFILTYMAFLTFLFFPAMPPWMASQNGLLPHVYRVWHLATGYLTISGNGLPTLFSIFTPNDTAAMPSLHAALPTLLFLFSISAKNKILTIILGIYALTIYFGIVYLGEHYFIDAAAGIGYAIISFITIQLLTARYRSLDNFSVQKLLHQKDSFR